MKKPQQQQHRKKLAKVKGFIRDSTDAHERTNERTNKRRRNSLDFHNLVFVRISIGVWVLIKIPYKSLLETHTRCIKHFRNINSDNWFFAGSVNLIHRSGCAAASAGLHPKIWIRFFCTLEKVFMHHFYSFVNMFISIIFLFHECVIWKCAPDCG